MMESFLIILLLCISVLHMTVKIEAADKINITSDITQLFRKPQMDGRIVGGAPAPIVSFPYQLSLRYNGRHLCGAAILSDHFAITAAHCIASDMSIPRLSLRAGSSSLYAGGTTHPVTSVHLHPQYDRYLQDYDLAIVETKIPFAKNVRSAPISLPQSGVNPIVGSMAVVTGWGITKEGRVGPSMNLLYVKVPIVDPEVCARSYVGYGQITSRMVCAGYHEGQRDACQGDSGGPLVADGILVGIVSWGAGCGRPNLPGIYTNLAEPSLRTWISQKTGGL